MVTTVGDEEEGISIAQELIGRRVAACVNVLPGIKSIYRWQGKICRDSELLLMIKTTIEEYDAASAIIQELHSYDVPEILAFDIAQGDARFLDWIASCVDKSVPLDDDDEDFPEVD